MCGKWDDILLEWVNCLRVSKPIHNLGTLQNGNFFTSFLKLLNTNNTKDIPVEGVLPEIYKLLQNEYPNSGIEPVTQLANLTDPDLSVILSLLMHYSCILDRREALTSPLCYNLSKDSQVSIKSFLENISCNITLPELVDITAKCTPSNSNEQSHPKTTLDWISAGDSPLSSRSPLQDFLKTPVLKTGRLLEKEREIKKLKADLELEKFEKIDLQDELKEHKERLVTLGKQLKVKMGEISKLRGDLCAVEHRVTPHKNKKHSTLEHHLKSEIKNLEEYVQQLQSEQEELQLDKEKYLKKLKTSESDIILYKEKVFSLENTCEQLTEKHRDQQMALQTLQANCVELNGLLSELQSANKSNDSLLEESVNGNIDNKRRKTFSCETLAHSVVEVQLREVENENVQLKVELKENLQVSEKLGKELAIVRERVEDYTKSFDSLNGSNRDLSDRVEVLEELQEKLEISRRELLENVQNLTEDKLELQESNTKLTDKLEESFVCQKGLQSDFDSISKDLATKSCQYEKLQFESDCLQKNYKLVTENYNCCKFEFDALQNAFDLFNGKFYSNLRKFASFINYDESSFDKNDFFETLLTKLQEKLEFDNEEKSICARNFEELKIALEKTVLDLKNNVLVLEKDNGSKALLCGELEKNLRVAENSCKVLERAIIKSHENVQELTGKIEEMTKTILELELLKEIIKERVENNNELRQSVNELKSDLEKKEVEIVMIETKFIEEIASLEQVNLVFKRVFDDYKELEVEKNVGSYEGENEALQTLKKKSAKELYKLNHNIELIITNLESKKVDLQICKDNCEIKSQELMELKQVQLEANKQYQSNEKELDRQIELLSETVGNLTEELTVSVRNYEVVGGKLQEITTIYETLKTEKLSLLKQSEGLKNELKIATENLVKVEKLCEEKDDVVDETNQQLLKCKLELEATKLRVADMKVEFSELLKNLNEVNLRKVELKDVNAEFVEKIYNLEKELQVMSDFKEDLIEKNNEIQENNLRLIQELSDKNKEFSNYLESVKVDREKTENDIVDLERELSDKEKLTEEMDVDSKKYQLEMTNLTGEMAQLKNTLLQLKNCEVECLEEIKTLKNDLNLSIEQYKEVVSAKDDLKHVLTTQIVEITEKLSQQIKSCKSLEETNSQLVTQLNKTENNVKLLEAVKIDLELKIVKLKNDYNEEYMSTLQQHKEEMEHLMETKNKLHLDVGKLNCEIEKKTSGHSKLVERLERAENSLEEIESEKLSLIEKMTVLQQGNVVLEKNYEELKVTYEKYVENSENQLRKSEEVIKKQLESFENDKIELDKVITSLSHEMEANTLRLSDSQGEFEILVFKKEEEITKMKDELEKYMLEVDELTVEQNSLQITISNSHETINKLISSNSVSKKQLQVEQTNCNNLQINYELLSTSKAKLEEQLYQTELQLVQLQKHKELVDLELEKVTKNKEVIIDDLHGRLETTETDLVLKLNDISKLKTDLQDLQKVIVVLENSNKQLEDGKQFLEEKLLVIEEDNMEKIKDCQEMFNLMKNKHDLLENNYTAIKNSCECLKNDLVKSMQEKVELQSEISDKTLLITDLTEQLQKSKDNADSASKSIEELSASISSKVDDIEKLNRDKIDVEIRLNKVKLELENAHKEREIIVESHKKMIKETECNILSAHENAVEFKNELVNAERDTIDAKKARKEIEVLLKRETTAREILKEKLLEESNEKSKLVLLQYKFVNFVEVIHKNLQEIDGLEVNSDDLLETISTDVENRLISIFSKQRELSEFIKVLESDKVQTEGRLKFLEGQKEDLSLEKEGLYKKYEMLETEVAGKTRDSQSYETLVTEHEILKEKYEQFLKYNRDNNHLKVELENKLAEMKIKNSDLFSNYQKFCEQFGGYKLEIESLIKQRNVVDGIVNSMAQNFVALQIKTFFVTEESYKAHYEKIQSLEIITSDIQKQFVRITKSLYNFCYTLTNIFEKTITGIISDNGVINWGSLFESLSTRESELKLEEIKELASNALEQIGGFVVPNEKSKVLKENLQTRSNVSSVKEDEWKRKYMGVKQKLTLVENAKNNYEKKIQQLREENKRLSVGRNVEDMDSESHYKTLLRQHLQTKEEHESLISECDFKYKELLREFELYKQRGGKVNIPDCDKEIRTSNNTESTINKPETVSGYVRMIKTETPQPKTTDNKSEIVGTRKEQSSSSSSSNNNRELTSLREAYGNLLSDNSKLELENVTVRRLLEDRNAQIADLSVTREAYERLLEENSKLLADLDTVRYKRGRDREEYGKLLRRREEGRVKEVVEEYEGKLDRMKEKMIKLYKEEVDKEMQKMLSEKSENRFLMEALEKLREELLLTRGKLHTAESERCRALEQLRSSHQQQLEQQQRQVQPLSSSRRHMNDSSRESLHSLGNQHQLQQRRDSTRSDSRLNRDRNSCVTKTTSTVEDRRYATLPRSVGTVDGVAVIEEIRIRKRTSISSVASLGQNYEMEDEGDMFNNKYLADLKEGRCNLPPNRESTSSRMSELAYRNSLCLPHLKSSYPLETQFASPNHFRDEELKSGNVDFDDSMSSRLLPADNNPISKQPPPSNQRRLKDAGTTSYKRPGPPTPSKHGGRASLSADQLLLPLREGNHSNNHLESKQQPPQPPKQRQTTPNRLRSLFRGRNSSSSSSSSVVNLQENRAVSPKGKRLSIFKKPR